jgi:soluble lytic murein transglycosylase-like protein
MPQIILWEQYISKRKQWIVSSLCILVTSLIIVGLMFHQTLADVRNRLNEMINPQLQEQYAEFKAKEEIYKVLRNRNLELDSAMEIAQAVINQSKKTNIPVTLFLALMQKESNFSVDAVSRVNAMGIMQIHPVTWDAYVKKLNLRVSRDKAFNPSLNIQVSAAILSDLRERYQKAGYQDTDLWDYVLSAYYAGPESVKGGLTDNHRQYVQRVRQYVREMSKIIES